MASDYSGILKSAGGNRWPGVRVVEKAGRFWAFLDLCVRVLTFGKNKAFLTSYVTTIGKRVAVPKDWPVPRERQYVVLRHELVHVRQQARLGLGFVWLGMVPWAVLYALLPLPMGLAWFRYCFEREAYAESVRAAIVVGEDPEAEREHAVAQISGPAYAWTWPFPARVRAWLKANS
jgi:hypothetical protein